ncbi:DNA helicase PIF1, ATP-dependent [Tanacetum coccineum]
MLDFYLANQRGQSLRVTLWGGVGDSLIEKKTAHVGICAIVLTLMAAKTYNNKLYLSSTSSTVICDNDDIPSLQELKSVTREGTVENPLLWARNRKNDTVTFQCKVMIKDIRRKSGWNYPSCGGEKCRKSISRKRGKFLCETCNRIVDYPVFRYRLEVVVADDTAHTVVVMFNEIATELLNCSADSLIEAEDEVGFCYLFQPHSYIDTNLHIQSAEDDSGLPTAIRNLIGTTHVMELKSHTYYEYGSYESFTCWKINLADLVDDGASSSNQLIIVDDSEPSFKRLSRQPSMCTPSKPNEEKRKERSELEDSDTDEVLCSAKDLHEINADGSVNKKKGKMCIDEDSDSVYTEYTEKYSISFRLASKICKDSFKYDYKTGWKSTELLSTNNNRTSRMNHTPYATMNRDKQDKERITPSVSDLLKKSLRIHSNTFIR